jgi:hypothetical protein
VGESNILFNSTSFDENYHDINGDPDRRTRNIAMLGWMRANVTASRILPVLRASLRLIDLEHLSAS